MTSNPASTSRSAAGPKVVGICPHQLPADRMFFVADAQLAAILRSVRGFEKKLVEHHFAQRVRRAEPPRDDPHRPIAIARQRRLHDGEIERDGTD